jgi:hypothetical protein
LFSPEQNTGPTGLPVAWNPCESPAQLFTPTDLKISVSVRFKILNQDVSASSSQPISPHAESMWKAFPTSSITTSPGIPKIMSTESAVLAELMP